MSDQSAESTIVRFICYILTAISLVWLMVAISAGWSFWAPLVGTVVGLILALPMYLKEQEAELVREAKRDRYRSAEQKGDTSRWEVDDRGQSPSPDPTQPPKILES